MNMYRRQVYNTASNREKGSIVWLVFYITAFTVALFIHLVPAIVFLLLAFITIPGVMEYAKMRNTLALDKNGLSVEMLTFPWKDIERLKMRSRDLLVVFTKSGETIISLDDLNDPPGEIFDRVRTFWEKYNGRIV